MSEPVAATPESEKSRKMTSPNALLKRELRGRLRARLAEYPLARRAEASARACLLLSEQRVWREAKTVLFYAPLGDELDLLPLLREGLAAGKAVALPGLAAGSGVYEVFQIQDLAADCARGKFGVLEPKPDCPPLPLNLLDMALVPGIGFDLAGYRLGRGGGYYDRLLSRITGAKCGVALDEQVVPQVPVEPHDIRLNYILTPTRWLETPGERPLFS